MPKSTATRQVDYLVNKKLVNRQVPDDNRRTVELTLTGKGKEVHTWFQGHLADVLNAVSQESSENELNLVLGVLPRIIYHSEGFLKKTGHWRRSQE